MSIWGERAEAKALEADIGVMADRIRQVQNTIFAKQQELNLAREAGWENSVRFLYGEIEGLKCALQILKGDT